MLLAGGVTGLEADRPTPVDPEAAEPPGNPLDRSPPPKPPETSR